MSARNNKGKEALLFEFVEARQSKRMAGKAIEEPTTFVEILENDIE